MLDSLALSDALGITPLDAATVEQKPSLAQNTSDMDGRTYRSLVPLNLGRGVSLARIVCKGMNST